MRKITAMAGAKLALAVMCGLGLLSASGCNAGQPNAEGTSEQDVPVDEQTYEESLRNPGEMGSLTAKNPGFELPDTEESTPGKAISAPERFSAKDGSIWVPVKSVKTSGAEGAESMECVETFDYSDAGDLLSYNWENKFNGANNTVERYSYDKHGYVRYIGRLYEGINYNHSEGGYDERVAKVDDDGRITETVTKDDQGTELTIAYEYGEESRLSKCVRELKDANLTTTTTMEFDGHGNMSRMTDVSQNALGSEQGSTVTFDYEYDANGRVTKCQRETTAVTDGVAENPTVRTSTYAYDDDGNVSEITSSYEGWDALTQTMAKITEVTKYEYERIEAPSDGAKLYLYDETFQKESPGSTIR